MDKFILVKKIECVLSEVSDGNLDRGVNLLMDLIHDTFTRDSELMNRSILLKSRLSKYRKDVSLNVVSHENSERQYSILSLGIIEVCNEIRSKSDQLSFIEETADRKKVEESEKKEIEMVLSNNVGFSYRNKHFRLKNISFKIFLGEIVVLIGENANGKSTLLEIIAGNYRHHTGHFSFPYLFKNGVDSWRKIKSRISYVSKTFFPWKNSLIDNLMYETSTSGVHPDLVDQEVEYYIVRYGLKEHIDKKWSELSGGYKLRFELVRALIKKPLLLILDEPLANLDINAQELFMQDMKDYVSKRRDNVSILMSSQHIREVASIADNFLFMNEGEVVFDSRYEMISKKFKYNYFELVTPIDNVDALKSLFDMKQVINIEKKTFSFLIIAEKTISYNQVLYTLLENRVVIESFHDISNSPKLLFEKNAYDAQV